MKLLNCITCSGLLPFVAGFGIPQQYLIKSSILLSSPTVLLTDGQGVPDVAMAAADTAAAIQESGVGEGFGAILRNIAVAITAIVFLGAALTLLTASVIIPAAARELEQECKELAPELWDEYMSLLKEGETMANRPDLMQELGQKLQPLVDAKIENEFSKAKERGIDVSDDERAWKALDSLNSKIPVPETTISTESSPPSIIQSSQWDDEDEVVKENKPGE